jgi:methionine-R-sulfoxide reductase
VLLIHSVIIAQKIPAVLAYDGDMSDSMPPLSPEEERVILRKGTEMPFSGKYNEEFREGTYLCRQCGTPLYVSNAKFHSNCGWPSFDQEIPGAVVKTPEDDSPWMEITCAHCGGHLGHVFYGEHFTEKETRHCVNSLSLKFVPAKA